MGNFVGIFLAALFFYGCVINPLIRMGDVKLVQRPEPAKVVTLPTVPEGPAQIKLSRRKLIIERVPVQYPTFLAAATNALHTEESCKNVKDIDAETFAWGLLGHSLKENGLCKGDPEERCDVSSTGARGPMQFMPGTWKDWGRDGSTEEIKGDGVKNSETLIDSSFAAAAYLCELRRKTGSWSHAMCRYYGDNVDDCDYENRVRAGIETIKTVLAEEEERKRLEAEAKKTKKSSMTLSKVKSTSKVR